MRDREKDYIESLEDRITRLEILNTRYEKRNKSLQAELNIWNESPVTEKVRVLEADNKALTEKVKELEGYLQLAESLLGDNQHSYYLSMIIKRKLSMKKLKRLKYLK